MRKWTNKWKVPEQAGPTVPHPGRPQSLPLLLRVLHQIFNLLQCLWEEGLFWDVLNSPSIVAELIFRYTENLDKEKGFMISHIWVLPLSLDL